MSHIIQLFLYMWIGLILTFNNLGPLERPWIWISVMLSVAAIDVIGFRQGLYGP